MALLVAGAAVVVLLVWAGAALLGLRSAAQVAAGHAREVSTALQDADTASALAAGRAAAEATARAHDRAEALPLRLGSRLPLGGPLLTDTRALVAAADTAVGAGALPVLEVADRLGADGGAGLLREDGSIDVDALAGAALVVEDAAEALDGADERAAAVDPDRFPASMRPQVVAAREGIAAVSDALSLVGPALTVAPDALGARGPRSYLVVFQNPAELRPTGGLFGTWASVDVDEGRVRLSGVGANDDFTGVRSPASGLGPEQRAYYGDGPVRLTNANLSPDFTVAAPLLVGAWEELGRPAPDAVVALDPQGMAPLLGRGSLEVPGGPAISADTVVDVLLRQAYRDFADGDGAARDRYLSNVVGTVFEQALGGGALTPTTLSGVADAARRGHLLAWSPVAPLQAVLEGAGLAGALPDPGPGAARVHLTNVDGSKLDYFLTLDAATTCPGEDGPASIVLRLRNDAPASVPPYVASKLPGASAPTTHTVQVALYLGSDGDPAQAAARTTVDVAGTSVRAATGAEAGWGWTRFDVDLPRGEDVEVTAATGGGALSEVSVQPMVRPAGVDVAPCAP